MKKWPQTETGSQTRASTLPVNSTFNCSQKLSPNLFGPIDTSLFFIAACVFLDYWIDLATIFFFGYSYLSTAIKGINLAEHWLITDSKSAYN